MKIKSCLLFLCILTFFNLFSQDKTPWKTNVIDSVVSLNLPGDLKMDTLMERLTTGKLEYEQLFFMFMKIDVIETAPMTRDTITLRDDYNKFIKGFLKQSNSELISKEEVQEGNFIGTYVKSRINNNEEIYFIEIKAFFLNEDTYCVQVIYPASIENTSTDFRKRFLNSFIIAQTAKQINTSLGIK